MRESAWQRGDDGYRSVLDAAEELAWSSGELTPLHVLVALSESDEPVAELVRVGEDPYGLRAAAFGELGPKGSSLTVDWRTWTATHSAEAWAEHEGRSASPRDLLVALIELQDVDVVAVCDAAGVDLRSARVVARDQCGWTEATAPALEYVCPAGTAGRPPLPVEDLPTDAWADLRLRQARLPFERMRATWQWEVLRGIEGDAAWRVANRRRVSDDARYSLTHHHEEAVNRLAAERIPHLLLPPFDVDAAAFEMTARRNFERRLARSRWARAFVGWPTWFGNRRVGIRDTWLRLRFRVTCRY